MNVSMAQNSKDLLTAKAFVAQEKNTTVTFISQRFNAISLIFRLKITLLRKTDVGAV